MIEVIVVVVVIGIMLTVALPKYNRVVEKSRQAEVLTNLAAIRGAQTRYYAENGSWTDNWTLLDADEPQDPERYFTYYIGFTPPDTVASAIRNTTNKNCCFGNYTVYVASSGRITKESAVGYESVP